jgi:TolA-binding protein
VPADFAYQLEDQIHKLEAEIKRLKQFIPQPQKQLKINKAHKRTAAIVCIHQEIKDEIKSRNISFSGLVENLLLEFIQGNSRL